MNLKYELTTLGCKVNQYESQQLRELLESHGLSPASPGEAPDLAVINTCAVTAAAARKSRQLSRRAGRHRQTRVVLVGCGASAEPHRLAGLPGVTAVWGHDRNVPAELARLLAAWDSDDGPGAARCVVPNPLPDAPRPPQGRSDRRDVSAWPALAEAAPSWQTGRPGRGAYSPIIDATPAASPVKPAGRFSRPIHRFDGHQRAFVKVQDGCDAHCTYCIIPKLRASPSFRPADEVVSEVAALVKNGYREVVLTGVFLGAYGHSTSRRGAWPAGPGRLAELVAAVARVPGLARLRLSSLEPGDVTPELLAVVTANPVCVPHLHLPLQSGSDRILRRMNRRYTREQFLATVDRIRDTLDRPAITTDILVGFPGETDADFADTLTVARKAGFCKIHAFPFSPRQGTAAARWASRFVRPEVVRRRMAALNELERELSLRFRRQFLGRTERALVEQRTGSAPSHRRGSAQEPQRGEPGTPRFLLVGRTDRYFEVHFEAARDLTGQLVPLRIASVTPTRTHGTLA